MAVSRNAAGLITVTGPQDGNLQTLNPSTSQNDVITARGVATIELEDDPLQRLSVASEARFVVASGTMSLDPETDTLFISGNAIVGNGGTGGVGDGAGGGIEVRGGATLDIGGETTGPGTSSSVADGVTYTAGTAVVFAKKGAGASDVATAAIYARANATVQLRGCTIISAAASRFDGPEGAVLGSNLIIQDVVWQNGRDEDTGYFAPRLFSPRYTIRNLTLIGGTMQIQARGSGGTIDGIRIERMHGGISVPGGNFGADTGPFVIKGVDGKHNSLVDISAFNGTLVRILNSLTGTDLNVDLQSRSHGNRSFGGFEFAQEIRFHVVDSAGNSIEGARTHVSDFVDGRFSDTGVDSQDNWWQKNIGINNGGSNSPGIRYNTQRNYSKVSGADGINAFLGNDAPLLGTKIFNLRPGQGDSTRGVAAQPSTLPAKPVIYRGMINDSSDMLPWSTDSYLHIAALQAITHKSDLVIDVETEMLLDPSITQTDQTIVAAYAGLAVNHAVLVKLITLTAARNLDEWYDWLKWHKLQDAGNVHPTRASMVASADGTVLDLGDYNVTVGNGGVLTAGTKFRSIRTTGTVNLSPLSNGRINIGYQDSTGKSILVKLGGFSTGVVWDADNGATLNWIPPHPAVDEVRIPVPPNSIVNITAKRDGFDYRKYTINAADVAELDVVLRRNTNVDLAETLNGENLISYHGLRTSLYDANIYFDSAPTPNVLRLGNVRLSGKQALTRALFDRRMGTQAAMEATHSYQGSGRAYDIFSNRMRWDLSWLTIGRQPTETNLETNPLTELRKLASWGLYTVGADDATPYLPPDNVDYFVTIDILANPLSPTSAELADAGVRMAENAEFQAAAARATAAVIDPQIEQVDADVKALSQQIRSLPIDELLQVDTIERVVPLTTSTPNIWSGVGGTTYAVAGGHLQVDIDGATESEAGNVAGTLNFEGFAPFTVTQPGNDRVVLRVTVRCQALGGSDRTVSPDLVWEWDAPTAGIPERRALGFLKATHPVSMLAPTASLGPAYVIEYDMGRAATFQVTDAAVRIAEKIRSADDYLRVVITSVEWVTRHEATVDDFKADLSAIDLSNLDVKVSSRMPASDFLPPYRIIEPTYDGTRGEGAVNGMEASDDDFAVDGAHVQRSGAIHQTGEIRRAVWTFPTVKPAQDLSISASLQWKRPDGADFDSGTRAQAAMTATLYVGNDLDGTNDTGATSVLTTTVPHGAQAAQPVVSLALTDAQRAPFNSIMLKLEGGTVGQQNRAYLWNLKVEVDGQRYMLNRIRFIDRMQRAKIHATAESAAFIEGGETLKTFARRASTVATDWSGGRD